MDANGVDQGNLQVAVGGEFTHSDIQDSDKSVTKGIGVSVGVNPNQDTGGVSGVSLTYNDSKKEGVTRATIGEGTITVGGVEDDKGVNRDVAKAQETTIDEGMEVSVNVPIELIKDPKKYFEDSNKNIRDLPKDIKELPVNIQKKITEVKAWAEAHGLKIGLSGEGENLEVKLYVPEGMQDSNFALGDNTKIDVRYLTEAEVAAAGLEPGTQVSVITADGKTEIVIGEGNPAVCIPFAAACAGAAQLAVDAIAVAIGIGLANDNPKEKGQQAQGGSSASAGGAMPPEDDGDWEPDDSNNRNPTNIKVPKDGTKMSTNDALDAAREFLGDGYKDMGNGRYVSQDGLRQVRLGDSDILGEHGGGPHINLEILEENLAKPGKMKINQNIHIYLKD